MYRQDSGRCLLMPILDKYRRKFVEKDAKCIYEYLASCCGLLDCQDCSCMMPGNHKPICAEDAAAALRRLRVLLLSFSMPSIEVDEMLAMSASTSSDQVQVRCLTHRAS